MVINEIMTHQEAIAYLYDIKTDPVYNITKKEEEAIDIAMNHLENCLFTIKNLYICIDKEKQTVLCVDNKNGSMHSVKISDIHNEKQFSVLFYYDKEGAMRDCDSANEFMFETHFMPVTVEQKVSVI